MLKAYVINLDRSPERMERMRALLCAMKIPFERVTAVDGSVLTHQELKEKVSVELGALPPFPAQLGCFLSHRAVWQRISDSRDDYGLVLEDDVIFARNFAQIIAEPKLFNGFPDIIRLEGWPEKVRIPSDGEVLDDGYKLHRLAWDTSGSCGYLLSRTGAAMLLKAEKHYRYPVDHLLFRAQSGLSETLSIKAIVPAACFQYLFYHGHAEDYMKSTIARAKLQNPQKNGTKKLPHIRIYKEIKRNIRNAIDFAVASRLKAVNLHPCGPLALPDDK